MTDENAEGCIACGWTSKQQRQCCYSSHVKLIYGAHNRGVWSIGSDLILKERPDEGPKLEVKALSQLIAHKDIPVPKVLRDWVDDNHRYFILEERVDGQMLEEAWPFLSTSQKALIADQVAEATISSESKRNLKKRFPPCEPYVLTHCDLNAGNIMVKDGKLVGILDWEYAAYYPVWYEYVSASWGLTEMDAEWKTLLRERLDAYGDAKEFWTYLCHLRQYPNIDGEGREILEKLPSD
ncbi:kinase-like protein [Aspergillus sergii]|uniref:Kinase-like protein n=1 Tax=Aspergillus sergii TaxID=1034303 RepID=A0A5N6XF94_9EURO|nr:kinase-like protein [Aspergillus sergii]